MFGFFVLFFVKQKTAYEMRISDWSSDVCSSDLTGTIIGMARALGETAPLLMIGMRAFIATPPGGITDPATVLPVQIFLWSDEVSKGFRSEEHTSELQSLMRISYAVFCLKKKKKQKNNDTDNSKKTTQK